MTSITSSLLLSCSWTFTYIQTIQLLHAHTICHHTLPCCLDTPHTIYAPHAVQPQLATNPQQDYVAFLGENIDLDCGLQFGRLMTTRFIEWRTASGEILASTGNPGSPGDRYQFNRQTFQLTIERVPLSAELLSPFDGYICRTTGSSLLATQTNLDASEVYLTVEGMDNYAQCHGYCV